MASDEQAAQQLAKRLIANNLLETQKLFGRRDVAVLQFPVRPDDRGVVDLGIKTLYRRVDCTGKPSRKRPRTNVDASSATVIQGGNSQHGANAAPNGLSQVKAAVLPRVAEGLPPLQNAKGRATAAQESKLPGVDVSRGISSSESTSLALMTSNRARPETASLVAGTVSEALAKDRPAWHPPWKMFRGISGHLGWVRSVAVDYSNEWFATGSADRTVKIWDLASGRLKLTLTGHISTVRGIAISPRHPYMFTVGEDKTVKCWDLEQNKVIRNYHGHLSGVYCVSLHPTLDVLMTGGRDSTVRVWDIRTRSQIFVLGGHRDTVNSLITQVADPQIVSASVDSTVRMWDLAAGKCCATLTNHKKGVRALVRHPREFSFASASADNIKTWALPDGTFMRNLSGQHREKLVNALAINDDGVLVSGGDDGSLGFWDYSAAHCFQNEQTIVQPGSLDCEAGIFAMAFDHSGSRLITCEADKTIKMWKEDDAATPETHPLEWEPDMRPKRY